MRRSLVTFLATTLATLLLSGAAAITSPGSAATTPGSELAVNQQLNSGDWLQNGGYRLVMQTDGNLVLYGPGGPLWASYTNSPSAFVVNQGDGNIVIYAANRRGVVWSSRTNNKGAGRLVMQGDGNVVQYNSRSGQPTWTTYTNNGTSKMKASGAVAFARQQIGKPYLYGGNGPGSYDCSGLTKAAFASVGVTLNRTSQNQWTQGVSVSRSDLQPGDLVFYNNLSHVAIYAGNDEVIQALKTGTTVNYYPISYAGGINGYRRDA